MNTRSASYRFKKEWFARILRCPEARRHLWSLYYAGEAYEELHPDAVYVRLLEESLGRLLARHLSDETRHALVFRALLAEEGSSPAPLPAEEDLGFYLLSQVAPDVVAAGKEGRPFTRVETMRYMAFLHALELRSISDLCALQDAARENGEPRLADRFACILRDEHFHAAYTLQAVYRLAADRREAQAILRRVLKAEHRHYAVVLGVFLDRFETLGLAPPTLPGRLRSRLVSWLVRRGLACPRLPLYRRLPPRLMPGAPMEGAAAPAPRESC